MVRRWVAWVLLGGVATAAWGQEFAAPGPYVAGWREVTVTRPDASVFQALCYYPAQQAAENAVLDPSGAPYAAVVFGHGFLTSPDKYRSTLAHLASWGYVLLAPRSGGEFLPSHAAFAEDLRHGLTWLAMQSDTAASFLYQVVDVAALGLSGHSMGAGCSILAAAADDRVRAVANLAAAETNPSAVVAMGSMTAPVALIAAGADGIAPVGSHAQPIYTGGSAPKQLVVILGGYHCGFLDSGMLFCDGGSITRAEQLTATRTLLTSFFDLYLKGRQEAWSAVWGPARMDDSRWSVQFDAGILLTPARVELADYPGNEVTAPLQLSNTSDLADRYDILIEDNEWVTTTDLAQSPWLEPGAAVGIGVRVVLPDVYSADIDTALVTARSQRDGATRAYLGVASSLRLPGDVDGDGCVTMTDLSSFLQGWLGHGCGALEECGAGDFNGSGQVDLADFALLGSYWLQCP